MSNDHSPGTQQDYLFESQTRFPYLLFLPEEYGGDPSKKWPLIMFLHGAGERGDDLTILRDYGPAKEAERNPSFPFICVSPQCQEDEIWLSHSGALKELLDEIIDA